METPQIDRPLFLRPDPREVPEDASRLLMLECSEKNAVLATVLAALRSDQVALIQGVEPQLADEIIASVAGHLDLHRQLLVQTAFASLHGHRVNIGKHFMSVNRRKDYQFIPPHSEGQRGMNMQLVALYCHENTTDGGESILMNTDSNSPVWGVLRELVVKIDLCGRSLTQAETARVKMMYHVNLPDDILQQSDVVVSERDSPLPGVKLLNVLARPRSCHSRILGREVNVYWDNIASTDYDSGLEYLELLRRNGLLRVPNDGEVNIAALDNAHPRRVWSSGVSYASLFKSRIVRKLAAGELVIMNNLTWTHSTNNWTPGSGTRKVAAAFA